LLKRVHLLDLRVLYPLDWDLIWASASITGKLLIIEPDVTYGGIGAELAARVIEYMPGVRIKRLGAPRETIPANPERHGAMLPSREQILEAIRGML
jgi:pyruvate dehydrogenase E1 component beta subunit